MLTAQIKRRLAMKEIRTAAANKKLEERVHKDRNSQTSTLAKLAPPHTAAHKLSHQLLNFHTGTPLGR
jgi:hypothetical protein